jgi:flagellar protein FliO/FliZ
MQALTFFFAFVVVLALIGVVAWLIRRFASNRLGANTQRGRMPRLAVIDAAAVDGRRRLVLVRRDNVEHLLMIGGPTDIVVEPNIVRGAPSRDQLPPRPAVASPDMQARIVPLPDPAGWGDNEAARGEPFDHAEPQMPEPPPRPSRPAFADEARRSPRPERPADPLAGFTPEPMGGRPEPVAPPAAPPRMPRSEPTVRSEPMMPRPARQTPPEMPKAPPREARPAPPQPSPPPVPPMSSADQNLAEMAQRLEAALRRPGGEAVAPPVAPEPPAARPVPRSEQPPATPAGPTPKSGFDNLEDEMASLLGRPKNSS